MERFISRYRNGAFLDGCGITFSSTEEAIEKFGSPNRTFEKELKNKKSEIPDLLLGYIWPDIKLLFIQIGHLNKTFLFDIEIFSSPDDKLSVNIGDSKEKVLKIYGEPETSSKDELSYDGVGENYIEWVRFKINDDSVSSIQCTVALNENFTAL